MKLETAFEVIIVGLGPAGVSTALMLAESGLKIAIIDKAVFPRDKICGDAISGNVIHTLKRLPNNIYDKFLNEFEAKLPSYGIRFYAPNQQHLDIPFSLPPSDNQILIHNSKFIIHNSIAAGYISKRIDFDNFLFRQLKHYPNISVFENCKIENITLSDENVIVESADKSFSGKIIIGADGANSIVLKKLFPEQLHNEHLCTGLRSYYTNVSGFTDSNFIELYFLKNTLPGYFWIFPLPDNIANVGIGMLTSHLKAKKINLKALMSDIINDNKLISSRFSNAQQADDFKAYSLPLWSSKKNISFERCLLTGDAASLVDPFTGEGVGNAMLSGRIAAEQILDCFKNKDFSAAYLKNYDKKIYNKMCDELKISRTMQKLSKYPSLFNLVVNKAAKNQTLRNTLISMLNNISLKKQLSKPGFYLKLIFNR